MNYNDNRMSGNGVFDGLPPVVVKPAPLPINTHSEEDLRFQDRQNSRMSLEGNLHHSNEHSSHISHSFITDQNGPDVNRGNQSHSQSLQHLPQPLPRLPHSIQNPVPIPDQGNLAMLQLISQAPFNPELLKIPEALALQKAINGGQVDPVVLLNQVITISKHLLRLSKKSYIILYCCRSENIDILSFSVHTWKSTTNTT